MQILGILVDWLHLEENQLDILWKNLSTVCVVVDRDSARRPQSMMNTTSSPVMQASKTKGLVPRGAQLSAKSLCKKLVLVLQVWPSFSRVELSEGENFMIFMIMLFFHRQTERF